MVASTFLSQALQRKTEMICGRIFGLTLAANDRVAYIAHVVLGSPSHITTISICVFKSTFRDYRSRTRDLSSEIWAPDLFPVFASHLSARGARAPSVWNAIFRREKSTLTLSLSLILILAFFESGLPFFRRIIYFAFEENFFPRVKNFWPTPTFAHMAQRHRVCRGVNIITLNRYSILVLYNLARFDCTSSELDHLYDHDSKKNCVSNGICGR